MLSFIQQPPRDIGEEDSDGQRRPESRPPHVGDVWPIEAVNDRPEVWLAQWRIYEIVHQDPDRVTRHLVGWATRAGDGQVSSAVRYIGPDTRCGMTRSGRTYRLQGPGLSEEARYLWCVWKRLDGIDDTPDVTDELAALLESAGQQH